MKRFVWRLQRVLDIKTKQEQKKKAELVKLTERLSQARSELLTQKRILEDIIDSVTRERPNERLGKQELFLKCSVTNDELIKRLAKRVSKLESAQKQKIDEVLRLKRFNEGLEKLRNDAKARFIKEQDKFEQKEMDEGATVSFARKVIQKLKS